MFKLFALKTLPFISNQLYYFSIFFEVSVRVYRYIQSLLPTISDVCIIIMSVLLIQNIDG